MILYHFTKKENLQNILDNGLIINSNVKGLQCRGKRNCIFLTNDKNYIHKVVSDVSNYIMINVNVDGLKIEPEHDWSKIYKDEKFYPKKHITFICNENIDKCRLSS